MIHGHFRRAPRSRWRPVLFCACFAAASHAPSDAGAVHRYTFDDGTAADTIGNAHATLVGTTGRIEAGFLDLSANQGETSNASAVKQGTGASYLDLPNGIFSAAVHSGQAGAVTLEFWAQPTRNRRWAALGSFGIATDGVEGSSAAGASYVQIIPSGGSAPYRFRATSKHSGNSEEGFADHPSELSTSTLQHIVVVFDQSQGLPGTLSLYVDGDLSAAAAIASGLDLSQLDDRNNWLGRSQYNDPLFSGLIDEFVIHDHALTDFEVRQRQQRGPMGEDPPPPGDGASGLDRPEPVGPWFNGVFPPSAPGHTGGWTTEIAFPGLSFSEPMYLTAVPRSNRLAIVEKRGRIFTFENDRDTSAATPLLDLTPASVDPTGNVYTNSDSGMTGVAFHPEFGMEGSPNRGYIYVTYKWRPDGLGGNSDYAYWRLSRFTVPDGAFDADEASEFVLVQQLDRQMWHDAGCVLFGADGFLYFSIGDEGGADDQFNVTQTLSNRLFSGIFRIDVDQNPGRSHPIRRHPANSFLPNNWPDSFTQGYFIPNDNPFLDPAGGNLEEYYCLGLRNAFRFYQDPVTGLLWAGDVGQSAREEFNVILPGANYQWPYREGSFSGPKNKPSSVVGTEVPPLWDYGISVGRCAVGGAVYRGSRFPELSGKHLFMDNVSQRIWAITTTGPGVDSIEELTQLPGSGFFSGPTSIGADQQGELYITKLEGGRIHRLTREGASVPEPPGLLSQTGVFTDLAALIPHPSLIPYTPNSPLWSDAAEKSRWLILPNDGIHDSPSEKIVFNPEGNWTFPPGAVLVKHFELPVDPADPSVLRRLETRFLVMDETGSAYGLAYRWLPDGSDALLLPGGLSEEIPVAGGQPPQTWDYPSRSDCLLCHTPQTGYVLGLRTHQLNSPQTYPATGRTANQLATLHSLGCLAGDFRPEFLPYYLTARRLDDASASLELRARSYLDSNCSHCHQPGGARANFDARLTTPLHDQNLIHGPLFGAFTGRPGEKVVFPSDPGTSAAHFRLATTGAFKMPPLAKNRVDDDAVALIESWIRSLPARPGAALALELSAPGSIAVRVSFTSPVSGLAASDFTLLNATADNLDEISGYEYFLSLTPNRPGTVAIQLPENRAVDESGAGNFPSNLLTTVAAEDGLVTWLTFDEPSGSVALDSVGSNHGQILNASDTARVPGRHGGALALDGIDDRVELENLATDDFTLSLWLNTTQTFPQGDHAPNATAILYADAPGTQNDFILAGTRDADGVNRATWFTGNPQINLHGATPINTGQWVHLAVTRERSTGLIRLYVDGHLEGQATGNSSSPLTANPVITLGNGERALDGLIDDFRLYHRVLGPDEILEQRDASSNADAYTRWIADRLPGLSHLHDRREDPEHDGLTNFQEWAFGLSPLAFDTNPAAPGIDAESAFTLSFPRRQGTGSPTYRILISEDLAGWQDATSDMEETAVEPLPDGIERVTYRYTGPLGRSGKLFARLSVDH